MRKHVFALGLPSVICCLGLALAACQTGTAEPVAPSPERGDGGSTGQGGASGRGGSGGSSPSPGAGGSGAGGDSGGKGGGPGQPDGGPREPGPRRDAGSDGAPSGSGGSAGPMGPTDGGDPSSDAGPSANPALDQACTPMIEFTNQVPTSAGGKRFDTMVPNVVATMQAHSRAICRLIYRNPSEVKKIPRIRLVIDTHDGVAYAGGAEIHFSANYIEKIGGNAQAQAFEINGVLVHEGTHVWQYNNGGGWLVEGMADYVRYKAGFDQISRRRTGGSYMGAYTTTGFFIAWIEDKYDKDFGYKVNMGMKASSFSFEAFVKQVTGKDVNAVWTEYQAAIK